MIDLMGVIYATENDTELKEITKSRSIAAIPVDGRYRLIDFVLSNMVNSGIRNVGIITQSRYSSLMVHLGSGKEWNLNHKNNGLFILPPFVGRDSRGWFSGSIDALHSILNYVKKSEQQYVLICGSNIICNINYNEALQFHINKNADITIIYNDDKNMNNEELQKHILLQLDKDSRILDIEIKPAIPKSTQLSMNMYIIEGSLLESIIEEGFSRGKSDFIRDIVLDKKDILKIYGYQFNGYMKCIDSICNYYKHNMDLLDPSVKNELFFKYGNIYTRVRDEVPAKYSCDASIRNCIAEDGCIIDGEVENSILFQGVKIYKGAKVKNSVIMQNCEIYEDSILENTILDKAVIIKKGKKIIGQENYPVVVGKGIVI